MFKQLTEAFVGLVFGVCLFVSAPSHALVVDETITLNDADLAAFIPSGTTRRGDHHIIFTGLPNSGIASDAIVTFSVRGDFDETGENITLDVDGELFGTI